MIDNKNTKSEAAALIESLESERDALAEQLRVMRKALEGVKEIAENAECPACGASIGEHVRGGYFHRETNWTCQGKSPAGTEDVTWQVAAVEKMQSALALTPTAAEAQAKANAEKAAKWDEARQIALALDEKLSEALKTKVGFADKDFEIAVTLLGALIEAAFGQKVPENGLVCSAVLTDGSEIFVEARRRTGEPYVKQAEAWRARIAELEATARENAEKAALLDWLDHTRPSLSFGCSPEYPLGAWGIYWTNAQTKQVEEAEAERLPDALRAAREHESNG